MTRNEFLNGLPPQPPPPDVLTALAQVIEVHISDLTVAASSARRGGEPGDAQSCHDKRLGLERLVRWIKSPDMELRYSHE